MSALTDTIDAEVTALLPQIQTKQSAFAGSHAGKFYQGMKTPNPIPKDGLAKAVDKTLHPSDQVEDWNAFGLMLAATQKWAIEIVSYNGPQGQGYVVRAWVEEGTATKLRRWNFGPETDRDSDWDIVTTPA